MLDNDATHSPSLPPTLIAVSIRTAFIALKLQELTSERNAGAEVSVVGIGSSYMCTYSAQRRIVIHIHTAQQWEKIKSIKPVMKNPSTSTSQSLQVGPL